MNFNSRSCDKKRSKSKDTKCNSVKTIILNELKPINVDTTCKSEYKTLEYRPTTRSDIPLSLKKVKSIREQRKPAACKQVTKTESENELGTEIGSPKEEAPYEQDTERKNG